MKNRPCRSGSPDSSMPLLHQLALPAHRETSRRPRRRRPADASRTRSCVHQKDPGFRRRAPRRERPRSCRGQTANTDERPAQRRLDLRRRFYKSMPAGALPLASGWTPCQNNRDLLQDSLDDRIYAGAFVRSASSAAAGARLRDSRQTCAGYLQLDPQPPQIHRREVLDALVADLQAQRPDHIAVTGDLVNIALEAEFAPARAWLESIGTPRTRHRGSRQSRCLCARHASIASLKCGETICAATTR